MHFQSGVSAWPTALVKMPDGALCKSVDNPGLLREAKQAWATAGRDPAKLFTLYRHHNVSTAEGDWQAALAHWRRMFARWVDRTYLEQYAPFVDYVSEANEYSATSTWTNPADKAKVLQNVRAAVTVWNGEYRGKVVHSADGGQGLIPAHCRLALLAGPVGNDIPREIYQLAVSEDSPIDYHAYCHCFNGQRSPFDWVDHSGRVFRHEQEYGIKPRYIFGESSPYLGVFEGWRHPQVLRGELPKLVAVMRAWVRDMQQTPAYREGRIIGPGAWFTSGGGPTWQWYALETPELSALADMLRDEWKPGETPVDEPVKTQVKWHALYIYDLADLPYQARARTALNMRDANGNIMPGSTVPAGATVTVHALRELIGPNALGERYEDRAVLAPDGRNVWRANLERLP